MSEAAVHEDPGADYGQESGGHDNEWAHEHGTGGKPQSEPGRRRATRRVGGPPEEWVRRPVGDFDPRYKSPRGAVVLSMLWPGLGQVYTGFYKRGVMLSVTMISMIFFTANAGNDTGPPLAFATFFTWMFSLIDAGRMAALYNYAISGGEEIEMPQDIKMPNVGGSIVAGAILMVFGGIALSNTLYDIPLDWLENWWPIFPIGIGGYLLGRGIMDHMNAGPPPVALTDPLSAEDD